MGNSSSHSSSQRSLSMSKRPVLANWLRNHGYENIPHYEFYRELFPQGELMQYIPGIKDIDEPEWRFNALVFEHTRQFYNKPVRDPKTGETYYVQKERTKHRLVCDDLIAIDRAVERSMETGNFCYMAPISYCGKSRKKSNHRFLYALIIEVDGLITQKVDGQKNLRQLGMENLIHQWGGNNEPKWQHGLYVAPTAVVCSGSGVHLYWFLKDPYPLYGGKRYKDGSTERMSQWEQFRSQFSKYIWNDAISDWPVQKEHLGQTFRLVGSSSKTGEVVEAFWISKKRYTMEELFDQKGCAAKDMFEPAPREFWETTSKKDLDLTKRPKGEGVSPTMLEAKEKWPKWYQERIIEKKPAREKGHWVADEAVYEWYKRQIEENPHVGCRYYRLYTLAQYGAKCQIPFSQVQKDCWAFGRKFQQLSDEQKLEDWEIRKAIQAYFNTKAHESKIDFINEKAHLNIEKNQRNYNKRSEHLHAPVVQRQNMATGTFKKTVNIVPLQRDLMYREAVEEGRVGRPGNSGTKEQIVANWRKEHPDGKKADCIRDTGLTKPTVYKWWGN